jgi:hypothetical protein
MNVATASSTSDLRVICPAAQKMTHCSAGRASKKCVARAPLGTRHTLLEMLATQRRTRRLVGHDGGSTSPRLLARVEWKDPDVAESCRGAFGIVAETERGLGTGGDCCADGPRNKGQQEPK